MTVAARRDVALVAAGTALAVAYVAAVWACDLTDCRRPLLWGPTETLLWVGTGLSYVLVGAYAWNRWPTSHLGWWISAAGFAWFVLPDDDFLRTSIARSWDVSLTYFFAVRDLYIAALVALVLAFPSGRLSQRDRLVVGAVTAFYLLRNLSIMAFWVPATGGWGAVRNLLLVRSDPAMVDRLESFVYELDDPILLGLIAVVLWHWWTASEPGRRLRQPLVWAALPWSAAFTLGIVDLLVNETSSGLDNTQQLLGRLGAIALPFGFAATIVQQRAAHARLGPLLADLTGPMRPGGVRQSLAHALGDPSLQLAFHRAETSGYVDSTGRTIHLPASNDGRRSVTVIDQADEPLVTLIHDPALDRDLVTAAGSALRIALDNERLHATVRAQLEDVRASRARIVEAADAARRHVERDLHDGAQQRLVSLSLALQLARERAGNPDPSLIDLIDEVANELDDAISELRELARGIYPSTLVEGGLRPAIESLIDRAAVPVRLEMEDRRYPEAVEHTAYFVVAEALTNATKHAAANTVTITTSATSTHLEVTITDDGIGGADPAGTGLQGIADRIATEDGELDIESPPGAGTIIRCRLPLDHDHCDRQP